MTKEYNIGDTVQICIDNPDHYSKNLREFSEGRQVIIKEIQEIKDLDPIYVIEFLEPYMGVTGYTTCFFARALRKVNNV